MEDGKQEREDCWRLFRGPDMNDYHENLRWKLRGGAGGGGPPSCHCLQMAPYSGTLRAFRSGRRAGGVTWDLNFPCSVQPGAKYIQIKHSLQQVGGSGLVSFSENIPVIGAGVRLAIQGSEIPISNTDLLWHLKKVVAFDCLSFHNQECRAVR